jgi:alkanesulfonate monooxygenase SsuD/methylene tetrahydromethanopterin reductase-like flavin-dependent oxidoreductase (luciferase family)
MLAFHMLCHEDEATAHDLARDLINQYLASLVDGASGWLDGSSSNDYPGYDAIIRGLKADSFESQLAQGAVWVGSPDSISEQIAAYAEAVGGFEIASMQVNFAGLPYEVASRSLELFGREVLPKFSPLAVTTP